MKRTFIILTVFLALLRNAWSEPSPFILLTQPKAGTHLVLKLLRMMSKKENYRVFNHFDGSSSPDQVEEYLRQGNIPYFHLFFPHVAYQYFLTNHLQAKVVVIIRDIRDAYVSYGHWFSRDPNESVQDKINRAFTDVCYLEMSKNLPIFLNHPRFYVIRFEDLVGPEGGGSLEKQKKTIEDLAHYLGYEFTSEQIDWFMAHLYGNQEGTPESKTFRNGKIGSWKDTLAQEHIHFIKEHFNITLFRLGYIRDFNW